LASKVASGYLGPVVDIAQTVVQAGKPARTARAAVKDTLAEQAKSARVPMTLQNFNRTGAQAGMTLEGGAQK